MDSRSAAVFKKGIRGYDGIRGMDGKDERRYIGDLKFIDCRSRRDGQAVSAARSSAANGTMRRLIKRSLIRNEV